MEEFLKLLDKYGLELGFLNGDKRGDVLYDINYIRNATKMDNAYEGLLDKLDEMLIKIKDYSKFHQKVNIPEQYKSIESIIKKDVSVVIKKDLEKGVRSYLIGIDVPNERWAFIEKILLENPKELCVNDKEFKLKLMYEPTKELKKEVKRLMRLTDELEADESIRQELYKIALRVKDILIKVEDDPDWYLEYGKNNPLFKRLLAETEK